MERPLPGQIESQVRWLAENLAHPEAKIAACALADEITALVNDDRYVSRVQLEHNKQVAIGHVKDAFKNQVWSHEAVASLVKALNALGTSRPLRQDCLVSIGDPAEMSPEQLARGWEMLLDGLAKLGWDVRGHVQETRRSFVHTQNEPGVWHTASLEPPREYFQHCFDRGRICVRCGVSEQTAYGLLQTRYCPGRRPTERPDPADPDDDDLGTFDPLPAYQAPDADPDTPRS